MTLGLFYPHFFSEVGGSVSGLRKIWAALVHQVLCFYRYVRIVLLQTKCNLSLTILYTQSCRAVSWGRYPRQA